MGARRVPVGRSWMEVTMSHPRLRWTTARWLCAALLWLGWTSPGAPADEPILPDTPLSVEACVAIALERNDLLAQAEAGVQSSRGSYWQSYSNLLPNVSASAGWGRSYPAREIAVFDGDRLIGFQASPYDGSLSLRASQTLLSLPAIQGTRRARRSLHASEHDLVATREEIEVTARQQFFTLLAARKLAEVEVRAVELAGEQLRRAETLYRLGSVARSDVLQAQVNLAEAEQIALNRRNAVDLERGRLAMVMGLDPRTSVRIDTTLSVPAGPLAGPLDEWITQAIGQRADLQAARLRVEASQLAVSAAKLARLPSVGLDYTWRRSSSSDDAWLSNPLVLQTNWSVGIGASIQLFDGLGMEGRVQSAKGDARLRREQFERLEKEVALEVRDAYLSAANEWENLQAAETSVALNRENLRLQQALYESGAGTLLEWDNARLDLRRAEVSLIQAEINLLLAHVRFRKAVGD
ncbi:MAG: hypothetical protein GF330_12430 [Candidatus Eisenbacteria bacterium]|nr:hypothetical protein [Candidatus Eisenbacteria bacterium]